MKKKVYCSFLGMVLFGGLLLASLTVHANESTSQKEEKSEVTTTTSVPKLPTMETKETVSSTTEDKKLNPAVKIDIENDFDPDNGWTSLNPDKGEIGTIPIKDGKTLNYHLGLRSGSTAIVKADAFGSNVFWNKDGKSIACGATSGTTIANKSDYKLMGYYKKVLPSGLPAFLAVVENGATENQLSYLQYGNPDGSVRIRIQDKNLSAEAQTKQLLEKMSASINSKNIVVRNLGSNKGVYLEQDTFRMNIELNSNSSDYFHWRGDNPLNIPQFTDSGWEKSNYPSGTYMPTKSINTVQMWKQKENVAPGESMISGYTFRNIEQEERVADPTISIDKDFDRFNGWTPLDPSKVEKGTIVIKEGKTLKYSVSPYEGVTAANLGSHVVIEEEGKSGVTPLGAQSLNLQNYSLLGYFKKSLSTGLPAFLVVLENTSTGNQISYLQYGTKEGTIRVRTQSKNCSLTTQTQQLKESAAGSNWFNEARISIPVRTLANNKGMCIREVNQKNLLQKIQVNVEFDGTDSDYSHWKGSSAVPEFSDTGWEDKNYPEGVFENSADNKLYMWKQKENVRPAEAMEAGYTVKNVELESRVADPSISLNDDFDPLNGWKLLSDTNQSYLSDGRIKINENLLCYDRQWSGLFNEKPHLGNVYLKDTKINQKIFNSYGDDSNQYIPPYEGPTLFDYRVLATGMKTLSSGLPAFLTVLESVKGKDQISFIMYGTQTGRIQIRMQTRNLSIEPRKNTNLRWQIKVGSKGKLYNLGHARGVYFVKSGYRMNYDFSASLKGFPHFGFAQYSNGHSLEGPSWTSGDYPPDELTYKTVLEGKLEWDVSGMYDLVELVACTEPQTLNSGEFIEGSVEQNIQLQDEDSVRIQYVDSEGNRLTKDKVISGKRGEAYDVSGSDYQLSFPGYELNQELYPKNTKGTFIENGSIVVYQYKRIKDSVLVRYQDEEGNPIHESKVLVGQVGEAYDVSVPEYQLSIPGYELDKSKLPENIKGTIISPGIFVTYVYQKLKVTPAGYFEVPKNVSLHALKENGKDIVGGKGTITYHSVENENDRAIQVFTDPIADLTTAAADVPEKKKNVKISVYHSDKVTPLEKDTPLGELSKDSSTYNFYLKAPKEHFQSGRLDYKGTMTFTAAFK